MVKGRHTKVWVALMFALTVHSSATGRAEAAPGIVHIGGSVPEAQQITVRNAVSRATVEAGWFPGATVLSKADGAALIRCNDSTTPWSCVPPVLAASDIHRVLVVTVDAKPGDDGSPVVVLVGRLISTSPQSAVVRQRFCEHCTEDRLDKEATELVRQMLRESAVRDGKTIVEIRSEPPGATISLDGTRIGATNGTFHTYPGKHAVVIEKSGYASETREVLAEEGATTELAVTLRGSAAAPPSSAPKSRSRVVPGVLLGTGLVAIGVGITLQVTKDGPPLGEPQPQRIYSAPGIGLAVAGAALTGAGVYLWSKATGGRADSAPAVSLVNGGGMVGWSRHY